MKIAALGRSAMLYNTVVKLAEDGHDIVSITTAKAPGDYSRNEHDFEALAGTLGCPFLLTNSSDEAMERFKDADLCVSVNWVSVLAQRHIDAVPLGILNAHAGDLPSYRGNACPNWAILNGEKTVGLCVHAMSGGQLDCGRVIAKASLDLTEDTYIADIYDWMEAMVPGLFAEAVANLEQEPGFALYATQPEDGFRCYPRLPENGLIRWDGPVETIHALIRACGRPLDCAYTYYILNGTIHRLHIARARIASRTTPDMAHPGQVLRNDPDSGESLVRCGDGVLAVEECFFPGGDGFRPGRAWRTIRMRLGANAEDMLWLKENG